MPEITLVGGSLGAGKTTFLTNLLRNGSLTERDGIIVMDAAGDVDYSRIYGLAQIVGTSVSNETTSCTVCDGPESTLNQISAMQDLERIVVELSGQMPLSVMRNGLASRGIPTSRSIYLVDPRNFELVQAADEVPYAHVVGMTKSDADLDISRYNPQAKLVRIGEDEACTLDELFEGVQVDELVVEAGHRHHHDHNFGRGMVTKWSSKVHNPYYSPEDLGRMLSSLAKSYDRIKGYVALTGEEVFSFDGVQGEFGHSIVNDSSLGNGTILIANGQDRSFPKSDVVESTSFLTEKPDVNPVIRRGSSRARFDDYVEQAFSAKQYDDALGAAEQHQFETGDSSLFDSSLPVFAEGKLDLIEGGQLSRSQRVRQAMSALYYLQESPNTSKDVRCALERGFVEDYAQMSDLDWSEIRNGSNPEETIEHIRLIRSRIY